jgi:hypothetical protein
MGMSARGACLDGLRLAVSCVCSNIFAFLNRNNLHMQAVAIVLNISYLL